jgi:5-(carboxyamino)imidazole ribonucleotide mutase
MKKKKLKKTSLVAIVMGSDSDFLVMQEAARALIEFGVPHEVCILSAHRTPQEMSTFAMEARSRGIVVMIAGAGGAAHLPGMIAAHTEVPVIGVPVPQGTLNGQDALLSIVQMPKGVPVATVAIGNAWNAGVLATQILGAMDQIYWNRIAQYKKDLHDMVLSKKIPEISPI